MVPSSPELSTDNNKIITVAIYEQIAVEITADPAAGLPALASSYVGMASLTEGELQGVSGTGIAIAFDDFQFAMAPTSYAEQVGNTPLGACTSFGNTAGNRNCWRRGDLRWYGGNISGAGVGGSHWNEAACDANSLACPRGGVISNFAPFDNPYLIRAWSPQGMTFDGLCVNGTDGVCNGTPSTKSIYEFLAPTNQPDYTFSFWGEIETARQQDPGDPWNQQLGSRYGLLKSQTLIRGNAAGSIFRAFQFTDPANRTFGMLYHSRLSGDFRFSVNQSSGGATDTVGAPPQFDAEEGLHFRNVDAYIPFGQLYYQAIVIGAEGSLGGFYIELPKIPDVAPVYSKFYGLMSGDTQGYETARYHVNNWNVPCAAGDQRCQDYRLSHGYSRWGDWYPGGSGTRNARNSTSDGIFFRACQACGSFQAFAKRPVRIDVRGEAFSMQRTQNYTNGPGDGPGPIATGVGNNQTITTRVANLGDSRAEGLLIQHFRLTSCSSGPGIC